MSLHTKLNAPSYNVSRDHVVHLGAVDIYHATTKVQK